MITTALLLTIALIVFIVGFAILSVGGAIGVILFSDLFIAAAIIVGLAILIIKRKKR
jgi:uncharacterized membrane protein